MAGAINVKSGKVIKTTRGKAVVQVDCELSCGQDHATCPLNVLLYGGTRSRYEEVEAENVLNAEEGDIVKVGVSAGKINLGIFSVYGALFLALVVSIALGYLLMAYIPGSNGFAIVAAIITAILLAGSLLRYLDKHFRPGYRVVQILYSKTDLTENPQHNAGNLFSREDNARQEAKKQSSSW